MVHREERDGTRPKLGSFPGLHMRCNGAVGLPSFLQEAWVTFAGEGEQVESLLHSGAVFSVLNGQKGNLSQGKCELKGFFRKGGTQ